MCQMLNAEYLYAANGVPIVRSRMLLCYQQCAWLPCLLPGVCQLYNAEYFYAAHRVPIVQRRVHVAFYVVGWQGGKLVHMLH
jgi:hypothetical protein